MVKIAMLFPYAPSYRGPIYQLMDENLHIDWFFCGNAKRNLKLLDYQKLKNVNTSLIEKKIGPIKYYSGIGKLNLEKYDVLIIAGVYQNLTEWLIALKYGRFKKKPVVYFWTHGMYGKESAIRFKLKTLFYRSGQGIFLYGNYAKDIMLKKGFCENKLRVIHNSLDYEKQLVLRHSSKLTNVYRDHFNNDYPILLFLGRLTPVKKLDMLITAVSHLRNEDENYNIMLIGDGPEKDKLVSQAEEHGISDRIWFYGACYDETINAELVYNADLCVAPGNIGLTAMHVLMFGCPALTHDCFMWQMPEFESITPYVTGNFFKYQNQESLEECISEWFRVNGNCREYVRLNCYKEIDTKWTPSFQLDVLKKTLNIV